MEGCGYGQKKRPQGVRLKGGGDCLIAIDRRCVRRSMGGIVQVEGEPVL